MFTLFPILISSIIFLTFLYVAYKNKDLKITITIYNIVLTAMCFLLTNVIIYENNYHNFTDVSYYCEYDNIEIVSIDTLCNDNINISEKYIMYIDDDKYQVTFCYNEPKEFERLSFDFFVRDVEGNLVWSTIFCDDLKLYRNKIKI